MRDAFAIYLDANAGLPLCARARQELAAYLSGNRVAVNPSSAHGAGRATLSYIHEARDRVLRSLAFLHPDGRSRGSELVWTGSGSEANRIAIQAALLTGARELSAKGLKPHWITSGVEHASTRAMIEWSKAQGFELSILPTLADTRPDTRGLGGLLKPNTVLVSLIWVGNETGAITDLAPVLAPDSALVARPEVVLHLDAAQAWGKLTALPQGLERVDRMTLAPHKIGGLSGVGCLWGRRSLDLSLVQMPLGTPNTLGVIAAGAAALSLDARVWEQALRPSRDALEERLLTRIPGLCVTAAAAPRSANTLHFVVEDSRNTTLVETLDLAGFAVSAGSACSSGVREPSPVLLAAGMDENLAKTAVRVSLHEPIPMEVVDQFVETVARAVERERAVRRAALQIRNVRFDRDQSHEARGTSDPVRADKNSNI